MEIKDVVDKIISSISDTLIDNDRAEIRGFGSFSLKTVHKTVMRNPRDATVIENPHIARIVYFRAGKDLRLRVNKLNQP